MLSITEDAVEIIRGLTESGAGGVRISAGPASSNGHGPALLATLVPEPDSEDEVVDVGGAQVYVDPLAAPALDDKVLDAQVEGEQLQFAVLDRD